MRSGSSDPPRPIALADGNDELCPFAVIGRGRPDRLKSVDFGRSRLRPLVKADGSGLVCPEAVARDTVRPPTLGRLLWHRLLAAAMRTASSSEEGDRNKPGRRKRINASGKVREPPAGSARYSPMQRVQKAPLCRSDTAKPRGPGLASRPADREPPRRSQKDRHPGLQSP